MQIKANNTIAVYQFALLIWHVKRHTPAKHSFRKRMLLLLLLPLQIFAQDITGLWTGYLQTTGSRVYYELAISESNEKLVEIALQVKVTHGSSSRRPAMSISNGATWTRTGKRLGKREFSRGGKQRSVENQVVFKEEFTTM